MTEEQEWEQFKRQFFVKSSIDLHQYKPQQMRRRIGNFMSRKGVSDYTAFFRRLDTDAALYREFVDYLTINVTEFFRTPEKFEELENRVIPDLLKKGRPLKFWSAGCSTGAEPYTLAMILEKQMPRVQYHILATDLDTTMLAKAKEGVYSANELKNVTPERLKRYFHQEGDRYILQDEIKKNVEFRRHNLLLDRYETGFDLILCRNVVIYFTEEAKTGIYQRFFQSLNPDGVLFVGGTESILNYREIGFTYYLPFFYRKP